MSTSKEIPVDSGDRDKEPQVDVVVRDDRPAPVDLAEPTYATWPQRVIATAFDNAILAGITWLALGTGFIQPSLAPVFGPDGDPWPGNPMILVPVGALALLLVLQGTTGWTPGKLVVGIRVVSERTSGPAGIGRTLLRWLLHVLDAILLIGYLRPLWHPKRQTFADSIVHTSVVPALPDLPWRPKVVVQAAALVAVVLGIGYGCVPLSSGASSTVVGDATCTVDDGDPAFLGGEIRPGGSVLVEKERRMWTVREKLTPRLGATLNWRSDPSARDAEYRVEIDARPFSAGGAETGPTVSRSWDIGTGEGDDLSEEYPGSHHSRQTAPAGDVHDAQVEAVDSDSAIEDLGTDLFVDVRVLADGDVVAGCGGSVSYDDASRDL